MKKLFTLLLGITCFCQAFGYDFEVDHIYYNITSSTTVEVTSESTISISYFGNIAIPESVSHEGNKYTVTGIADYAFAFCSGLYNISIPNSVTYVGRSSFLACNELPVIDNIRYADTYIVEAVDKNLSTYTIKEGTKFIGGSAFAFCTNMTSITIPESVISIGGWAFSGCSSLPIIDNLRYADTYLVEAVDRNLSTYTIKEGTRFIGSTAFSGCYEMTSFSIPASVTSIGYMAFAWLPGLSSVTIPNSVTHIDNSAFAGCSSLTSITIPSSVTRIENNAFSGCSNLASITVESGNTVYDCRNNCNAIIENISSRLITGCKNTVIPSSITNIGEEAFFNCSGLTSITIPNTVTRIDNNAFAGCSSLTSITVESGNTVYDCRNNCNAIIETESNTLVAGCKNTVIPNSVTSLGNYAFYNIPGLTSVSIPESVTSIGDRAFSYCSGLTSITISASVTSIGAAAFEKCSSLTSITVESGNTVYDCRNNCNAIIETASNKLVAGCKNTIIPNSVTYLGQSAFYGSGLSSISIPGCVTSFDYNVFTECANLTDLYVEWSEPIDISYKYIFTDSYLSSATLHVPTGTKALYEAADVWKEFGNIVEYDVTDLEAISACQREAAIYNLNGLRLNGGSGIFIQNGKKILRK